MARRHGGPSGKAIFTLFGLVFLAGAVVLSRQEREQLSTIDREEEHAQVADGRGRLAQTPTDIPPRGLRDVFWRVVESVSNDRVTMVAAGVTFYLLLALFPALTAIVSLYGLLADPIEMTGHVRDMASVLPADAFAVFSDQLRSLVESRESALGAAFIIGLLVALWSAHIGTLAMFDAMNVAYGEVEKRSLLWLNLIALSFTLGALLAAVAVIGAVAVMPVVMAHIWLDPLKEDLALLARWPLLLLLVFMALTAIYRFGPSREPAKLRWLTWGAAGSTCAWMLMTLGFSWYLNNVADYNATYGALGGLIGFLIWTWLSVAIVLVGAELNAELEHQTICDSTTGKPRPLGARGAYVADHVGKGED